MRTFPPRRRYLPSARSPAEEGRGHRRGKDVSHGLRVLRDDKVCLLRYERHRGLFHHGSDERRKRVPIINPISKDLGVMRTFLAPGILENLAYNLNRGFRNPKVFEIGKVFFDEAGADLPREVYHVVSPSPARKESISGGSLTKASISSISKACWKACSIPSTFPLKCARPPGLFSTVALPRTSLDARKRLDRGGPGRSPRPIRIREKVLCAELDFDRISEWAEEDIQAHTRYPSMVRDFSFYVDDTVATRPS